MTQPEENLKLLGIYRVRPKYNWNTESHCLKNVVKTRTERPSDISDISYFINRAKKSDVVKINS